MKYGYIVKSGGVYYAAGEDVPEECKEEVLETMMEEALPFTDSDIQFETESVTEPVRRGRPRKTEL